MKKKPLLTKGPNGPAVKMPEAKHIQVLRGLAIKILAATVPENDYFDGEPVPFLTQECIYSTIDALGYKPERDISLMKKHHYLVPRSEAPDQITFYILKSKKRGQDLLLTLRQKAA